MNQSTWIILIAITILGGVVVSNSHARDPAQANAQACLAGPMNAPVCIQLRAEEARKHPDRSYSDAECSGLKMFEDPQPPGHPTLR